jgi:hypothetical protein
MITAAPGFAFMGARAVRGRSHRNVAVYSVRIATLWRHSAHGLRATTIWQSLPASLRREADSRFRFSNLWEETGCPHRPM